MPASSIISYFRDSRNNFNAARPAPLCTEIGQPVGQCQNIHISTNCYYGYHSPKTIENVQNNTDCEMLETPCANRNSTLQAGSRKRSADNSDYPQSKRIREEGMVPSTTNYNPCLLRPTHNNPDISRCLMVHMI